jgi:cytosine/adenosine deaminase-related metal-dependent hydrolase
VGLGIDNMFADYFDVVRACVLMARIKEQNALTMLTPEALELATMGGARALGLDAEIGGLRVGKWGDCVVIRCPSAGARRPPEEVALASGPRDVVATYVGGRDVYRNSRPL